MCISYLHCALLFAHLPITVPPIKNWDGNRFPAKKKLYAESNVTGSRTHGWGWYIVYKSSGGKIGNSSRGHGVLPFGMGRTWFKLAVTSSNWFLPVDANSVTWLVTSLQIQNSNNTNALLWLICALNYITKCYWSQEIILCIYWSGFLIQTSTREVV